jgi:hypothetical protein
MLRKKLRSKIKKKQLFLEECINLYKNNSTLNHIDSIMQKL